MWRLQLLFPARQMPQQLYPHKMPQWNKTISCLIVSCDTTCILFIAQGCNHQYPCFCPLPDISFYTNPANKFVCLFPSDLMQLLSQRVDGEKKSDLLFLAPFLILLLKVQLLQCRVDWHILLILFLPHFLLSFSAPPLFAFSYLCFINHLFHIKVWCCFKTFKEIIPNNSPACALHLSLSLAATTSSLVPSSPCQQTHFELWNTGNETPSGKPPWLAAMAAAMTG